MEDQPVELGQALTIQLPSIDSYPAPSVQWYNGDTPIQEDASRYHVTLDNHLVILETQNV